MRMEVHLQQRLEQRMHLSQQMLQNLELLQLPIMDLRDLILQELEANPTLEEKQDVEEPDPPTGEASLIPETDAEVQEQSVKQEILEAVEDQWAESERRTRRTDSAEDAERRMEMMNNFAQEVRSLRDHLTRQLALLELPAEDRAFCEFVIENVDDSGYLKTPIEDMVSSLPQELAGGEPETLARKLEHAATIVQQMEPKGVGARSIRECLILQLDVADPRYPILRKLIENHFEDVGANRLPRIVKAFIADPEMMKDLGYSGEPDPALVLDDLKQLLAEIVKLNPKPGASYSIDRVPKVYPEVVIKQVDGRYEIMLEDGWLPAISVNRSYEELLKERKLTPQERELAGRLARDERFQREQREWLAELARGKRLTPQDRTKSVEAQKVADAADEASRRFFEELAKEPSVNRDDRDFMKRKVDAGRKLITAIEQRRGTIYRITSEILKRQMDFFEHGTEHLRPLKMQEVADVLGIHLSTVSRAISEKWVETPRGIFPLKFFFASAAPRNDAPPPGLSLPGHPPGGPAGEPVPDEQTRLALMEKIREIVDAEDPKNPLSDLELVRRLAEQHRITAARRTIAKYREEMGVPSSRLRKKY
jgi:RNA polymerase sigma-54 factor